MAIVIHSVTVDNADLLARVAEEVFDREIIPDRLGAFLAAPGHVMFVAVDDQEVVGQIRGMVHLQPDRASDLYIDNLGVAPSHKRRGIATMLIAALIAWAKAQGCISVWLATETDNDEAMGLYGMLQFERKPSELFEAPIGDEIGRRG